MRLSYTDEEDYPGQFGLWQANCQRSLKSRKGQAVLRELEAALLALPEKRLIAHAIAKDGEVCAVGALLVARKEAAGLSRTDALATYAPDVPDEDGNEDGEELTEDIAEAEGVPRLVAWKLVELNDITLDTISERILGPSPHPWHYSNGYDGLGGRARGVTPEERYEKVLAWVRARIAA